MSNRDGGRELGEAGLQAENPRGSWTERVAARLLGEQEPIASQPEQMLVATQFPPHPHVERPPPDQKPSPPPKPTKPTKPPQDCDSVKGAIDADAVLSVLPVLAATVVSEKGAPAEVAQLCASL